jgi:ketosteroid isomerase-like protein
MARASEVTVDTLRAILDAFNRHDLDDIMAFFANDCVLLTPRGAGPRGQRFEGKDAVRQGLAARFEGIPDVHYGEDRHWVFGDFGVSEWRLTGTTTVDEPVDVYGCDHFTFRDGKVTVKNSYWKIVDA